MEDLPKNLKGQFEELISFFSSISNTYDKYEDQIIPQDTNKLKEIIGFLVELLGHISKNFTEINRDQYQQFLSTFHEHFEYDEHGDDNNYLEFEPHIGDESLPEHLHEFDEFFTKKTVNEFKTKLKKLAEKL